MVCNEQRKCKSARVGGSCGRKGMWEVAFERTDVIFGQAALSQSLHRWQKAIAPRPSFLITPSLFLRSLASPPPAIINNRRWSIGVSREGNGVVVENCRWRGGGRESSSTFNCGESRRNCFPRRGEITARPSGGMTVGEEGEGRGLSPI